MRAGHCKELRNCIYSRWNFQEVRAPIGRLFAANRPRRDLDIRSEDHCTPRMNWRMLDPHRWLPNRLVFGMPWSRRGDIRTQISRIGR